MLNINSELTYDKGKWFIDYMLGINGHEKEHECFDSMIFTISKNENTSAFFIDYDNIIERRILADLVFKEVEKSGYAMNMFRCDFDFNLLPFESPSFEKDVEEMQTLFGNYCRLYSTMGFAVIHSDQMGEIDEQIIPLVRHMHIIYEEKPDTMTFTEYLHRQLV